MLVQHLPHDFADRTGRADHRNAWHHAWVPFVSEENAPQLSHVTPPRPFDKSEEF
jgi:hypothetical protein